MRFLIAVPLAALLCLTACPVAEETVQETEDAGSTAVGVAEEMSEGTLGDADIESGELPGEEDAEDEVFEDE